MPLLMFPSTVLYCCLQVTTNHCAPSVFTSTRSSSFRISVLSVIKGLQGVPWLLTAFLEVFLSGQPVKHVYFGPDPQLSAFPLELRAASIDAIPVCWDMQNNEFKTY